MKEKLELKDGEFKFICDSYQKSKKAIDELNDAYMTETESIRDEIKVLQNKMSEIKNSKYEDKLSVIIIENSELKERIIAEWEDKTVKTLKYEFGNFTRTERKSVEVVDQSILIEELLGKGLLNAAVKSFDDKLLKGWIEAKIGIEGAVVNSKYSLTFKEAK